MSAVEAKRTLVKSPPEVWAQVSDPECLAEALGELGPITITRMEPESVVHWEGDRASGTVRLAPGGWGTKVELCAEPRALETEPVPEPEPEPVAPEPEPVAPEPEVRAVDVHSEHEVHESEERRGLFARWFRRRREAAAVAAPVPVPAPVAAAPEPAPEPEPEPVAAAPEPEPDPEPRYAIAPEEAEAALRATLDHLGAAHHRPFSRA